MMKKIVENIEKEIVELKKTVEEWEEKADLSVLKMTKQNLAHAYDWMALLSERIEEACHRWESEPSEVEVVPAMNVVVQPLEEQEEALSVKKEEDSKHSRGEYKTEEVAMGSTEEKSVVQESQETIHISISNTVCKVVEEREEEKVEIESKTTEYLLSQSYEEKAKKEIKNGDTMNETSILGEHLLKMENGMYASLSLNDSIRFSRAWFDEDTKQLEQFLQTIEESNSFEQGLSLAKQRITVDDESEEWLALVEIMDKYFND